mgnify:FL=1
MSAHSRIRPARSGLGAGGAAVERQSARDVEAERKGRAFIEHVNVVASAALLGRMAIEKSREGGKKEPEWLRAAYVETKQDLMALVAVACNAAGGQVRIRVPAVVWGRGRGGFSAGCVQVLDDAEFVAKLQRGAAGPTTQVDLGALRGLGFVPAVLAALVPFIPLLKGGVVLFGVAAVGGSLAALATSVSDALAASALAKARTSVFAKVASNQMTLKDAREAMALIDKSESARAATQARVRLARPSLIDRLFGQGAGRIVVWSGVALGAAAALYYFWPVLSARFRSRRALPVSTGNT